METLAASFRLLRPHLDPALVDRPAADRLAKLAGTLAPIHCAGFEVRLGRDRRVDLIQRITALDGEPRRLRAHVQRTKLLRGAPSWVPIEGFCTAWEKPAGTANQQFAGAFLEFDTDARGEPAPSLYLSLEPGWPRSSDRLTELVRYAWSLLAAGELPDGLSEGITRCVRPLPPGVAVTDIGFMLARDLGAVRLVLAPLRREQMSPLLRTMAWQDAPPRIGDALDLVPPAIEHLALSLDIGSRTLPRVGVEYYPGPFAADLPTWQACLDALSDAGLCTAAKRAALLRWPGYLEPTEDDQEWPASLLIASLLNRTDQFIVLARRLTFLKLVCTPDAPPEAKAYFGYGPRSFVADAPLPVPSPGSSPADGRAAAITLAATSGTREGADGATADGGRRALAAGTDYLLRARGDDDVWREFPRILEGTDEWVTAYIGAVLAGMPEKRCRAAARQAWDALLERRSPGAGWAYNGALPVDADSTLWAAELADALGDADALGTLVSVLQAHVHTDGGVATYTRGAEAGLRRLLGNLPLDGMFVAHACVTAAVAGRVELAARTIPFVVDRQDDDGRWRGYWWSDDEYTTALAVTALRSRNDGRWRAAIERARNWAANRLGTSGAAWSRHLGAASPFATALCIDILEGAAQWRGRRDDALRWLLSAQRADGSWPASALMRMPPTHAVNGDEDPRATTVSVDDGALFTTATVLRTLTRSVLDRR